MARLANALGKPEKRDAAAAAIRGLIDGIVLTPGEKRGELRNILEWTGSGAENEKTDIPLPENRSRWVRGQDSNLRLAGYEGLRSWPDPLQSSIHLSVVDYS